MVLSGKDAECVSEALRAAFNRFAVFEWFLKEKLGRNLEDLAAPAGLDEVVPIVVRKAAAGDWLVDLLEKALAVRMELALLHEAASRLGIRRSLPGAALADLSHFDLKPIDQAWLDSVAKADAGGRARRVLGFGVCSTEDRFLECLCKRIKRHLVSELTDEVDPLSLDARVDNVSKAVARMVKYRGKLATRSIVGRVKVDTAPPAAVADFWAQIDAAIGELPTNRLVLVFVGTDPSVFPADLHLLPAPSFQPADVSDWVAEVSRAQHWPDEVRTIFREDLLGQIERTAAATLEVWDTYDQLRDALGLIADDTYVRKLHMRVSNVASQD